MIGNSNKKELNNNESHPLRIVIGSDIFPTKNDLSLFEQGKIETLLPPKFLSLFQGADFSIVNVESPLTNDTKPICKMGPALKASPNSINFYSSLCVTAVCLANNHILDYGESAVNETITLFENIGIKTVGAGVTLNEARQPLLHQFPCGRSLAVVAMAESEFCIAGKDSSGANPIDFINYSLIKKLKTDANKVLVVLHAGTEMRKIPRPGLIDLCHFLVDQGADAIIVQHTHCIGAVEYYNNVPIVYGQGNFIFGRLSDNEFKPPTWWEGMSVELIWGESDARLEMQLHPFFQCVDSVGIRLPTSYEKENFSREQEALSKLLKDRDAIDQSWEAFCKESKTHALLNLIGASRIPRALACRGLPLVRLWLWLADTRMVRNMILCESHRELITTILKSLTKQPEQK